MKYLIHTSGGFDSTWSLMWFLENFDEKIIAHFLDYTTKNNMDSMQLLAYTRIRNYVDAHYPNRVKWMTSKLSMQDVAKPLDILMIAAFTGCIQKQFPSLEYIIKSAPIDEELRLGRGLASRRRRAEIITKTMSGGKALKVLEPLRQFKKKDAWDASGPWRSLTWSCRKPINAKTCGKCHACIMLTDSKYYEPVH
jgi:7-cyano-7-deazaguanine synthase in queuosine biosynthesis